MQTRADAICPRKFCRSIGLATSPAAATARATAATLATGTARTAAREHRLRLHRDQAFALRLFAGELAGAAAPDLETCASEALARGARGVS
jgi:hypothetical protein